MSELVQLRARGGGAPAPVERGAPDEARGRLLAYVETYGCQMNVADTEMVLGLLHAAGYGRTEDPTRADLILLNTCAVREKAEERVFARVSELAQHKTQAELARPDRPIVGITGCMAEHLKGAIRERAPYVDLVIGPDGYRRLVEHVEAARAGRAVDDTRLDRYETYDGLDPAREMTGGVTGHVTIQRGCDKFCAFCVVPYTRGRERGTPPREILRQVRAMAAAGYKEVQLLGQTVSSYRYEDVGFGDLLRAIATVDGIERIRFTSPYPLDFSDEVIAAMAETPKVCQHVHLPLQTASDAVLARMRRGYDFATYRRLVASLRAAMPRVAVTTDLMVGFCDETEAEFAEILRAQEELRFDAAFMFAYSEREGTTAARKMPDTVPEEVKSRRLAEVIALQQRITAEILGAQVGRRERVLVDHISKRSASEYLARTDEFRPVIVPAGRGVTPGAFLDVTIARATRAMLFGTVAGA
ncbi:MAG TPA: tRNA (N6-isopentenyl adenosine(37)-C2)-methylthiotransferase MiaB [Polyangia bacterium]|nr:tRNA (N6-isopentenyl adenosine(37)-C2)-methylthiotransferase MiaB [Polyangia bacterium]